MESLETLRTRLKVYPMLDESTEDTARRLRLRLRVYRGSAKVYIAPRNTIRKERSMRTFKQIYLAAVCALMVILFLGCATDYRKTKSPDLVLAAQAISDETEGLETTIKLVYSTGPANAIGKQFYAKWSSKLFPKTRLDKDAFNVILAKVDDAIGKYPSERNKRLKEMWKGSRAKETLEGYKTITNEMKKTVDALNAYFSGESNMEALLKLVGKVDSLVKAENARLKAEIGRSSP